MSVLAFIASVVASLAWPVVVVVLGVLFRSQVRVALESLARRLGSLRRLQAMGVNAEFSEEAGEVKEQLAESEEVQATSADDSPVLGRGYGLSRLIALTEVSPRAAVMEAFMILEGRALLAAQLTGWRPMGGVKSYSGAMRHLDTHFNLSDTFMESAIRLRHLRNEAAHSPEFAVTGTAAEDYVLSALSLAEVLERLTPIDTGEGMSH